MHIEARDISVRIGRAELLRAVDVQAAPGAVLGLIGPNGAGKSTLLRVLARLRRPSAGTVHYDGRSAADFAPRSLARRLAYLAQGSSVAWPLTVDGLVALGRVPHREGWGRHDDVEGAAAIEQALAAADLCACRERIADTLSGGELTRALLARALAVAGDALLADEPVAALDPSHQLQVMEILRERAGAGGTVIVVLHDLALAARYCDRLLLLHRGSVAASGAPHDVLDDALLREVYGVSMARGVHEGVPYLLPWRRAQPLQRDESTRCACAASARLATPAERQSRIGGVRPGAPDACVDERAPRNAALEAERGLPHGNHEHRDSERHHAHTALTEENADVEPHP